MLFATVSILFSCKKDDLSNKTDFLSFSVTSINRTGPQLDTVFIDNKYHMITLLFNDYIPLDSIPITFSANYTLIPGASCSPAEGETVSINLKDGYTIYTVTAENGDKADFYLILQDSQLQNAGFEDWYIAQGMSGSYTELGLSEGSTIWATANLGTSIYNKYGTTPLIDGDNTLASIITGETSAVPLTAGTIYSGKFDLNGAINNPTDPREASVLGIPFILRPTAMRIKYSYIPGDQYIQATPNNPNNIFGGFTVEDIPGNDSFSIYAYLEVRDENTIVEIGRSEFISGVEQSTLTETTIPFIYTSPAKPTHINVLMTSSKDGHLYTGAVGSQLIVDDLELLYE